MVPEVDRKKTIDTILSFNKEKKDGIRATKTKENGFQCTKRGSYVEQMEEEHDVLSNCSDETKDRRRQKKS